MDDVTAARSCGTCEELRLSLGGSPTSFTVMLLTRMRAQAQAAG